MNRSVKTDTLQQNSWQSISYSLYKHMHISYVSLYKHSLKLVLDNVTQSQGVFIDVCNEYLWTPC